MLVLTSLEEKKKRAKSKSLAIIKSLTKNVRNTAIILYDVTTISLRKIWMSV